MEASLNDFKLMLRGAEGVSDEALQLALDDAKHSVVYDGVAESHADFAALQRYKAAHLLVAWGQVSQGAVASESVGDVSRTYSASAASQPGSGDGYQDKYRRLLNSIVGFSYKIA